MQANSAIDKATRSASARIIVGDFCFPSGCLRTMATPAHSKALRMARKARAITYVMPVIIEALVPTRPIAC